MAYVHWVTIQLARDVDAELANIRTTSRRDITNPPVTLIQYTALMSRPRVFIHTWRTSYVSVVRPHIPSRLKTLIQWWITVGPAS